MNRIVNIAARSQQYISNLDMNIVRVINVNADEIVTVNQQQMLQSMDSNNDPLIHVDTGSEFLTVEYAFAKNKPKPDLYDTGSFQNKMFFKMESINEYHTSSNDSKTNKLIANYGDIFGVAPSNQPQIKKMNDADIVNDYFNKTIRG